MWGVFSSTALWKSGPFEGRVLRGEGGPFRACGRLPSRVGRTNASAPTQTVLAAAAGAAAAHAAVAAAVSGHDAAAEAAAWGVAQVDDARQRVGGVDRSGFRLPASSGFRRGARLSYFWQLAADH